MSPPGGFTHPYHLLPIPPDVLITAAVSVAFSTSLALGQYSVGVLEFGLLTV